MKTTWRICQNNGGECGCLVSSHDKSCPACLFRLHGPLERPWVWP